MTVSQVFPTLIEEFRMCYVTVSFRKKLPIAEPMSLHSVLPHTEPGLHAGDLQIFVPYFVNPHGLYNVYSLLLRHVCLEM